MRKLLLPALAMAVATTGHAGETRPGTGLQANGAPVMATATSSFKAKYGLEELSNVNIRPAGMPASGHKTRSEAEMVTDPKGSTSRYAMAVDIFLSHMGATHVGGFGAEGITSANGEEFYTRAMTLNFFQQGYSQGEIKGDSIVFKSGQYVYDTDDNQKAYMYGSCIEEEDGWPVITDSFVLTKDEQGRYVSAPGCYMLILTEEMAKEEIDATTEFICFGTNYVFTPLPADLAEIKLPADIEMKDCQLSANSLNNYGGMTLTDISVGVKGDNIYIGGLTDYIPDAYLMGRKTGDNTYTFDSHQYLGYYDHGDYPYLYEFSMVNPIYFAGDDLFFEPAESITMTYNEDRSMLTIEEDAGIFVNAYGDISTWNEVYWNVRIGDFNQALTPQAPTGVECYGSYGAPYLIFEWSDMSVEGLPMVTDSLWCEIIVNGAPYVFTPEYYEGLEEATDRVYYSTSGVHGMYPGSFSTIYLKEYEDRADELRTVGVRIGYEGAGEVTYADIVYAKGYEPFDDRAFTPGMPRELVYYKDYYSQIQFKFDGKDTEGNEIPERLLAAEIMLDGKPLVFNNSNYYFDGYDDKEVTVIGLSENSINYSNSLVTHYGDTYSLSLWGHDDIPEFKELAVRIICTGGDTMTYGETYPINLERPATPADPWDVEFDEENQQLKFGALPIADDGNGLAPWSYGYEVYVNDELYTFDAQLYELEENATVIPYEGFEYNYYFFLISQTIYDDTDWSVIGKEMSMQVDMGNGSPDVRKIGVRAVYTDAAGNRTYSKIVNSDGTNGDVSGATMLGADKDVKWFDLQGIEVEHPVNSGIYIRRQGTNTSKVIVK